mmetsp:Transcript_34075/g.54621  ORF Transcript_34075/g.54621 Transcript_34075/m.54621 type:complete len:288 (-) Transcript_34075:52-915(-)
MSQSPFQHPRLGDMSIELGIQSLDRNVCLLSGAIKQITQKLLAPLRGDIALSFIVVRIERLCQLLFAFIVISRQFAWSTFARIRLPRRSLLFLLLLILVLIATVVVHITAALHVFVLFGLLHIERCNDSRRFLVVCFLVQYQDFIAALLGHFVVAVETVLNRLLDQRPKLLVWLHFGFRIRRLLQIHFDALIAASLYRVEIFELRALNERLQNFVVIVVWYIFEQCFGEHRRGISSQRILRIEQLPADIQELSHLRSHIGFLGLCDICHCQARTTHHIAIGIPQRSQ